MPGTNPVADLIDYFSGLLGAALGRTSLVVLGMVMVQQALKRQGTKVDFRYKRLLPAMIISFVILEMILRSVNGRIAHVISMITVLLLLLAALFFLVSLFSVERNKDRQETAEPIDGIVADTVTPPVPHQEETLQLPGRPASETSLAHTGTETSEPMKENRKTGLRQVVISVAIAIAALMALFPPFVSKFRGVTIGRGYTFLFTMKGYREIDFAILIVEWCLLALVAGLVVYNLKGDMRPTTIMNKIRRTSGPARTNAENPSNTEVSDTSGSNTGDERTPVRTLEER